MQNMNNNTMYNFITHTKAHVNKLVDNTCCLLEKQKTIIIPAILNILPKGKSLSDSNPIFIFNWFLTIYYLNLIFNMISSSVYFLILLYSCL